MWRFRDRWLSLLLTLILGLSPLQGMVAAGLDLSTAASSMSSMPLRVAKALEDASPSALCQDCELDACCDTSPCDGPLCGVLLALPLQHRPLAVTTVLATVILPPSSDYADWHRGALYRPPRG